MRDRDRTGDDAPSPELLTAIEQATRAAPARLRFEGERDARPVAWLALLILVGLAGGAFVYVRAREEPPPARVEADLRWAVANVVRRVEELRSRTGRLPDADELEGLVSDLVVYERSGESYGVHGQRGAVRVEFDGSAPLEAWLRLRDY